MSPQPARLQPDPWVLRLLLNAPFRIVQSLLQLSAVHEGHRIPVVPGSAARSIFLRVLHPLSCLVVKPVLIQVVAGEGIPQSDLEVLLGLTPGEFSRLHAPLCKVLQPAVHLPKIAGHIPAEALQSADVLRREQGAGLRVHLRLWFPLPQADRSHIPAEYMEQTLGGIGVSKEILGRIQHGGQIPGDEVQIPVVQSGGSTQEGHGSCSGFVQNHFL